MADLCGGVPSCMILGHSAQGLFFGDGAERHFEFGSVGERAGIFGRDMGAGSVLEGPWRSGRSSGHCCRRMVTEPHITTGLNSRPPRVSEGAPAPPSAHPQSRPRTRKSEVHCAPAPQHPHRSARTTAPAPQHPHRSARSAEPSKQGNRSYLGFETATKESPKTIAVEEMLVDNDQGYFGASKTVRKPRPPYVFLRVGEVVMETRGHMVGVVVSWDPELRAPAEWVDRVYSDFQGIKAEKTPHYKVLFNGPAGSSLLVAYLPQTQLERIKGLRPDIPTLENYFTHFDGERFVMQPWLKAIFPEDEDVEN